MDKEWIHLPSRLVPEYEEGVQKFLAQARDYAKKREVILCPCIRCKNKKFMTFDKVYEHLIIKGFDPTYTIWFFHGETGTLQFQGEGSSLGVQEEENESRETFHLYRDVFVPDEEVGVTPSKVGTYVQQNGTIKQLQSMMHNLQRDMHEMRSRFFQNTRQRNEQKQELLQNVELHPQIQR